ncbi:ACP S-malonyltransferase [Streptomyces sp. DSM 44915]|uniref:[acyl-carrier-protein] S-malonyltransferase n=1 Tax=Streptomyces chisholmiae TaxID=3075540 RepID=A0ABU2JP66_9ACTN|nr:ACP S-malonyltransferase [Streptomyces sp. DSM 44915]MDT0266787.1 ACP S-malonyltransferase [Streptomyces sp. DSM 44915]
MLVLVAPGQGSQAPGFLQPWLELPGVAARLGEWSDVVGLDLVRFGTEADADEIRDTAVAQPLLVAGALLSADALFGAEAAPTPAEALGAIAGHSVGELPAAAISGVLTPAEAMALVARRATAMAKAATVAETGMSAVLGGEPDEVAAKLAELDLVAANNNGGGQVVAAGALDRLAALAADKPAGARVLPLKVAGAFHTAYMAAAVAEMAEAARQVTPGDPRVPFVSNADGAVVREGAEVLRRLVAQVSNPVRWDLCVDTFRELGVTALIELLPGGTLSSLARRNLPGVARVAIKGPEQLDQARALIAEHASQSPKTPE